ncbi:WecB/TagA/CpsF family glycosyltransferase [Streptomyces sp. O3]
MTAPWPEPGRNTVRRSGVRRGGAESGAPRPDAPVPDTPSHGGPRRGLASPAYAARTAHGVARAVDGTPDAGAGVAAATVICAGVPLAAVPRAEAAAAVVRLAAGGSAADVHLCDTYTLALADRDRRLRGLLRSAVLNLPDGHAVAWANRLVHRDRRLPREPLYGPDLLLDVFGVGESVGLRHYLLGASPDSVRRLTAALLARYPRTRIVGAEAAPRRALDAGERRSQLARIKDSGAQLVWLGVSVPRQHHAAARLAAAHPAVYVAVGAAFERVAETGSGTRWRETTARRALWGNPRFVWAAGKGAVRV